MQQPIDFVILYCDGSDPAFIARQKQYLPHSDDEDNIEFGPARYRDMGTLHYWFRAVEENAPWVRKIHLVTDNQVPDWIVRKHPKLHLVDHHDIIPEQYLPLFNSCAIEIFIHRIEGLSEQFVYFNDDTFLNAPLKPDDFFHHGAPRISPIFTNYYRIGDTSWHHQLFNSVRYAGRHCTSVKGTFGLIRRSIGRAYGLKNSWNNFVLLTARALTHTGFPYPRLGHQATPMLRSTYELLWNLETEMLESTASHRFRDYSDLNQNFFSNYNIFKGIFEPSYRTSYCTIKSESSYEEVINYINNGEVKLICVNDTANIDFDKITRQINEAFKSRYPNPSSFEKPDYFC